MFKVYCKTVDSPRKVGELICKANSVGEKAIWMLKDKCEEDFWVIETKCEKSPDLIVYQVGESLVVIEVDDECASEVIEPLMQNYGFENVKWIA